MARSKTKGRNKQRKNRGDGKESPPQAGLDSVPPTEQNTTQPNQVTDTPRRNSDTTTSVPQPIRTQGTQVQQGSTGSALSSTQGNLNVVSTSHGTTSIMDLNSPNRSVGATSHLLSLSRPSDRPSLDEGKQSFGTSDEPDLSLGAHANSLGTDFGAFNQSQEVSAITPFVGQDQSRMDFVKDDQDNDEEGVICVANTFTGITQEDQDDDGQVEDLDDDDDDNEDSVPPPLLSFRLGREADPMTMNQPIVEGQGAGTNYEPPKYQQWRSAPDPEESTTEASDLPSHQLSRSSDTISRSDKFGPPLPYHTSGKGTSESLLTAKKKSDTTSEGTTTKTDNRKPSAKTMTREDVLQDDTPPTIMNRGTTLPVVQEEGVGKTTRDPGTAPQGVMSTQDGIRYFSNGKIDLSGSPVPFMLSQVKKVMPSLFATKEGPLFVEKMWRAVGCLDTWAGLLDTFGPTQSGRDMVTQLFNIVKMAYENVTMDKLTYEYHDYCLQRLYISSIPSSVAIYYLEESKRNMMVPCLFMQQYDPSHCRVLYNRINSMEVKYNQVVAKAREESFRNKGKEADANILRMAQGMGLPTDTKTTTKKSAQKIQVTDASVQENKTVGWDDDAETLFPKEWNTKPDGNDKKYSLNPNTLKKRAISLLFPTRPPPDGQSHCYGRWVPDNGRVVWQNYPVPLRMDQLPANCVMNDSAHWGGRMAGGHVFSHDAKETHSFYRSMKERNERSNASLRQLGGRLPRSTDDFPEPTPKASYLLPSDLTTQRGRYQGTGRVEYPDVHTPRVDNHPGFYHPQSGQGYYQTPDATNKTGYTGVTYPTYGGNGGTYGSQDNSNTFLNQSGEGTAWSRYAQEERAGSVPDSIPDDIAWDPRTRTPPRHPMGGPGGNGHDEGPPWQNGNGGDGGGGAPDPYGGGDGSPGHGGGGGGPPGGGGGGPPGGGGGNGGGRNPFPQGLPQPSIKIKPDNKCYGTITDLAAFPVWIDNTVATLRSQGMITVMDHNYQPRTPQEKSDWVYNRGSTTYCAR